MAAKVAGTWQVLAPMGVGDLTTIDTTAAYRLGARCRAKDIGTTDYGDGDFIYLKGVASCARGSVCIIADDYSAVLIAARAIGAVCVSLGAVDAATKFGWFQVRGKAVALCDTVAAAAPCYIDGTSGRIDDAAVAGDAVQGMRTNTSDDTGTCVVTMASNCVVGDFDNA